MNPVSAPSRYVHIARHLSNTKHLVSQRPKYKSLTCRFGMVLKTYKMRTNDGGSSPYADHAHLVQDSKHINCFMLDVFNLYLKHVIQALINSTRKSQHQTIDFS
jgi:hypothetical protein